MDIKEYLEGFRKVKIVANRQLDKYYINKCGVIIALKRRTLQILKPKLADNGYYCVGLRDETGKRKYYSIHRLVALTFLKNPRGNKKYVNHIDGNEISFSTKLPTITTSSVSSLTANSVTIGGNITDIGGAIVTERGVCWSTTTNPTITNNKTSVGIVTGKPKKL